MITDNSLFKFTEQKRKSSLKKIVQLKHSLSVQKRRKTKELTDKKRVELKHALSIQKRRKNERVY